VGAKPKTTGTADLKRIRYTMTSIIQCHLSDKLSILFEPHHARWIGSHYL